MLISSRTATIASDIAVEDLRKEITVQLWDSVDADARAELSRAYSKAELTPEGWDLEWYTSVTTRTEMAWMQALQALLPHIVDGWGVRVHTTSGYHWLTVVLTPPAC